MVVLLVNSRLRLSIDWCVWGGVCGVVCVGCVGCVIMMVCECGGNGECDGSSCAYQACMHKVYMHTLVQSIANTTPPPQSSFLPSQLPQPTPPTAHAPFPRRHPPRLHRLHLESKAVEAVDAAAPRQAP